MASSEVSDSIALMYYLYIYHENGFVVRAYLSCCAQKQNVVSLASLIEELS